MELKAKPQTGLPERTTSVITATTEVVISEKSKLELASFDFSGTAVSRMSTMRKQRYSICLILASAITFFHFSTSVLM